MICLIMSMQAKAYVEAGGNISEKLEDISWIKDVSKCYMQASSSTHPSISDHNLSSSPVTTAVLIFCTSLFLNILILIFTVLYLDKVFAWISEQTQHKHQKDLYKASAIVLIFMNLATLISDVCLHFIDFPGQALYFLTTKVLFVFQSGFHSRYHSILL